MDDFLSNPNILKTKLIQTDTIFNELYVEGPLYINNDCHGIIIDTILSDVVYKSNPEFECKSFKTFETIKAECHLTSNLINGIEIDKFLTLNTPQKVFIDNLLGNIVISHMYLDGLFDGINITEIDQNAIKLSGEQFTGAEISFVNSGSDALDCDIENIEIVKTFNGLRLDDFILIEDDLKLFGKVVVNNFHAKRLTVSGEIKGKSLINKLDVKELDAVRFSRSKKQEISNPCHIEYAIVDGNFDADLINGYDVKKLKIHLKHIENIDNFLSSGEINLDTMIVNGSFHVQLINGHAFESIKNNAIWLNKNNVVNGEITFADGLIVDENLDAQKFNNILLSDFLQDIVLISDQENMYFGGTKIFTKPVETTGNIDTIQLNEMQSSNIFAKSLENQIAGDMFILGNVLFENVRIKGYVNKVNFPSIEKIYRFDETSQSHVLRKLAKFSEQITVGELSLLSGFNNIENVTYFLTNIIGKNSPEMLIHGHKAFVTGVHFGNDLIIDQYNGVELDAILRDFIMIDDTNSFVIGKDVAFENSVELSDVKIVGDILTKSIMGCDMEEWTHSSLKTDISSTIPGRLIFSKGTFLAANVLPVFVNEIPVANAISLNTHQTFDGNALFSDVYATSPIEVSGLVNGLNLVAERENTLMVSTENIAENVPCQKCLEGGVC